MAAMLFVVLQAHTAVQLAEADARGGNVLKLSNETVHFGYFSKTLEPKLTVESVTRVSPRSTVWTVHVVGYVGWGLSHFGSRPSLALKANFVQRNE